MANDPSSGGGDPDEAAESLVGKEDLLEELLTSSGAGDGLQSLTEFVERLEALEAAVADLDDALDDQIQDVRDRVIQVKRETDSKAPTEHDHPDLAADVDRVDDDLASLGEDVADLDDELDRVGDRVEAVDDRTTRGFSNYEDVLEYLIDATDGLNRKADTLARATTQLRERAGRLEAAEADRAAADALRRSAQVHGVTEAKCEDCGETVRLALLTGSTCPHCESSFARIDPSRGFFRSSVLRTGRRPALEGEVDRDGPDLDAIVDSDVEAPPDVTPAASPGAGSDEEGEGAVDDAPSSAPAVAGRDVEEVPGIGPAYAERLRSADVSTMGDLADADPHRLAGEVDEAPARVEKWVRRARETVESA